MRHIQLERRNDLHREHLVDVGLMLKNAHGADFARDYLEEAEVPESLIRRVLTVSKMRASDAVTPSGFDDFI
ncbi:hypothetical protein G4G28_18085 [Massilia sp. Dwa41.01b]|uniref:hypothetical protein n=1 Tax=unclassified Massilia TaxID=2609279 RepID=UPI001603A9A3|nr:MULTISPECIES: hypothetical protein [unclassified Massilia]QNA89926.1 hypothetical protein G4G28_18085 [Massilia sp. Dwa41.01b]QNB00810.1 hypothetical protein G4G31_21650 [Massilia sp. Se16.2.3]